MEDTFPCGGSLQPVVEDIPRTQEGPSGDQAIRQVITALSGSQGYSMTRGLGV